MMERIGTERLSESEEGVVDGKIFQVNARKHPPDRGYLA
jgi:hypothetical protein